MSAMTMRRGLGEGLWIAHVDRAMRKRDLDALAVKGLLESAIGLPRHTPLLDWSGHIRQRMITNELR